MQGASQTDGSPSRPPSFCYVLTVEDFSQAAEDSSQAAEDSSRTASICGGQGGIEQLTFPIAFVHTNFLLLFIHVIVITLHELYKHVDITSPQCMLD